jgi:hypothetical protein
MDRISFDVRDILATDDRAVVLGSLASKLKRTGKIMKTDFAIVLTVAKGEIVRFQMLEDSFAVSKVARGSPNYAKKRRGTIEDRDRSSLELSEERWSEDAIGRSCHHRPSDSRR